MGGRTPPQLSVLIFFWGGGEHLSMGCPMFWASCWGVGLEGQQPSAARHGSRRALRRLPGGADGSWSTEEKHSYGGLTHALMVLLAVCYNHREMLCLWYHFL